MAMLITSSVKICFQLVLISSGKMLFINTGSEQLTLVVQQLQ